MSQLDVVTRVEHEHTRYFCRLVSSRVFLLIEKPRCRVIGTSMLFYEDENKNQYLQL